ncbi:MAG: hypothetical protein KAT18_03065 [Candidatus Latescibacteria bacterium]|nr:hypothetical protein [Candidatus Latescibacterota bacterium]
MRSCIPPANRSEPARQASRSERIRPVSSPFSQIIKVTLPHWNHTHSLLIASITGILLLASLPTRALAQDDWFGPDKLLHFIGGFLATSVSYTVAANVWDMDHDRARMVGAATGVVLSVGKEIYDSLSGRGHASGKDLFWDGIGIGMGMMMINQMKPECGIRIDQSLLNAVDTTSGIPTLRSLWR